MAQNVVDTSNLPQINDARVVVLTSKWYDELVRSLHDRCVGVLNDNGVIDVTSHTLPGCLEFPYAANELVRHDPDIDAIVCLGVVLKGDTMHFEMIIDEDDELNKGIEAAVAAIEIIAWRRELQKPSHPQ